MEQENLRLYTTSSVLLTVELFMMLPLDNLDHKFCSND